MALARNTVLPKEPRKRRTFSKNRSKIEPRGLQNRALGPPKSSPERSKTRFLKTSNLKSFRGGGPLYQATTFEPNLAPFWRPKRPPKSRPKPEKIDVDKRCVFDIDFERGQAPFWKGFWKVFSKEICRKVQKRAFGENLKNSDFP